MTQEVHHADVDDENDRADDAEFGTSRQIVESAPAAGGQSGRGRGHRTTLSVQSVARPVSSRPRGPTRRELGPPVSGRVPVVGIIGGGSWVRMCAGPAAELGLALAVLRRGARRVRGSGGAVRAGGDRTRLSGTRVHCGLRPETPSTTSTSPLDVLAALVEAGARSNLSPEASWSPRCAPSAAGDRNASAAAGQELRRRRTGAEVGWPLIAKALAAGV